MPQVITRTAAESRPRWNCTAAPWSRSLRFINTSHAEVSTRTLRNSAIDVVVIHLGGTFSEANQRRKRILALAHALLAQQAVQGPSQNLGFCRVIPLRKSLHSTVLFRCYVGLLPYEFHKVHPSD